MPGSGPNKGFTSPLNHIQLLGEVDASLIPKRLKRVQGQPGLHNEAGLK